MLDPVFVTALTTISDGRLVALPGGVIIRDETGSILGAVGVSGDVSEPDEICAVAGVEAAGLQSRHRGPPGVAPTLTLGLPPRVRNRSYMMQDVPGVG